MTIRITIAAAALLALASCSSVPDDPKAEPSAKATPTAPSPTNVERLSLKDVEGLRVDISNGPDWLSTGFGSLWVKRDDGAVVRVAPSGKVRATIDPDLFTQPVCQGLGVSDDAVWVCATSGTIVRIDPETNDIVATIDVPKVNSQGRLTAVDGQVWLLTDKGRQLVGLSEETNRLGEPIELGASCTDISDTAPRGTLWVACAPDGVVLRVDLEQRKVTGKVSELRLATNVTVGRSAWVGFDGGLAQIDPTSLEVTMIHGGNPRLGSIRAADGSVWIREPSTFMTRLDPSTGAVRQVISAEDLPSGGDVIEFDGAVWATAYDDSTLVRLTPPG